MKFLCFTFVLFFPILAVAGVQQKSGTIWGEPISYELVILQNKNDPCDGKALITAGGKNRVVINTVNFEKEALTIWNTFEVSKKMPPTDLKSLMDHPAWKSGSSNQLHELEDLLEMAAWHPLYIKTLGTHQNRRKARSDFVKTFESIRRQTIEHHELSHLLDKEKMRDLGDSSEVRAFLAELAYGQNPLDSLWQAVAGMRNEIRQGKNLDASTMKIRLVLGKNFKILTDPQSLAHLLYQNTNRDLVSMMSEQKRKGGA